MKIQIEEPQQGRTIEISEQTLSDAIDCICKAGYSICLSDEITDLGEAAMETVACSEGVIEDIKKLAQTE